MSERVKKREEEAEKKNRSVKGEGRKEKVEKKEQGEHEQAHRVSTHR